MDPLHVIRLILKTENIIQQIGTNMTTTALLILGILCFLLFFKSINWFEKI